MRTLLLIACLSAVVACDRSPTAPTLPRPGSGPNSGTWIGTVSDGLNGQGSMRVALQETPFGGTGLLTGTWSVTYADVSKNTGGEVGGGVTGSSVLLTLRRANPPPCPTGGPVLVTFGTFQAFSLTLAGSTMSGPYDFLTCGVPVPGAITLTRQ